ncbi:MAG: hypothetical protein ACTH8F_12525, partial [Microbacterium sp.]
MAEKEDPSGSTEPTDSVGGSSGAGGSANVSSEMSFESMLGVITGVSDSGLEATILESGSGKAGWVLGTMGGADRDAWSPNRYYGYYGYEANERYFELLTNPDSIRQFDTALGALDTNIGKIRDDTMPGLSARQALIAAGLFNQFATQADTNQQALSTQHTDLSGEESSVKGATATALLASLEGHQKTLTSIHKQITDHGGVGAKLTTIAEAVKTFSTTVQGTWDTHRPTIVSTLNKARSAVLKDIYEHIEAGDKAWRAKGNNGMSKAETLRVLSTYTWGNRGGSAPEGFVSASGDLSSPATFDAINAKISEAIQAKLQVAAGEVFTAQQTLETTMRSSLRALDSMVDPVVAPDMPSPGPGGGGVGGPDGGSVGGPDGGSVGGPDGGSVGGPDGGSVGGPDGGSVGGPDGGSVGGPDGGSVGGPDGGSVGGPDGGSVGGPDGGSVGGPDGGAEGGPDLARGQHVPGGDATFGGGDHLGVAGDGLGGSGSFPEGGGPGGDGSSIFGGDSSQPGNQPGGGSSAGGGAFGPGGFGSMPGGRNSSSPTRSDRGDGFGEQDGSSVWGTDRPDVETVVGSAPAAPLLPGEGLPTDLTPKDLPIAPRESGSGSVGSDLGPVAGADGMPVG